MVIKVLGKADALAMRTGVGLELKIGLIRIPPMLPPTGTVFTNKNARSKSETIRRTTGIRKVRAATFAIRMDGQTDSTIESKEKN